MKKYIKFAVIFVFTLFFNPAIADEVKYGIGAALTDRLTIYLPINTDNFIVEPTLSYQHKKNDTVSPQTYNFENKLFQLGVGVFAKDTVIKDTIVYYGARVGYIKNEIVMGISGIQTSKFKDDGYFIAPTIGADYRLIANFSIGLDFSISYSKTVGDLTANYFGTETTSNTKSTTIQTAANIIVRYNF
jgi:hypothetical protein